MKIRNIIVGILTLGILNVFSGCEDFLDKSPDMGLSEDDVYKDYTSMRGFMDRAYNFLDNFHSYQNCNNGRTHIGAISDEFASLFNSAESKVVNSGNWLSKDGTDFEIGNGSNGNGTSIWKAYKGLRIVNRVIRDIDLVPGLSEGQRNELLGQSHFLRAWFYFQLIKRYGGMPIFDQLFVGDGDEDLPRKTYHESHAWMMTDIEKAISMLPDVWDDNNTGRPNKIAAMAFKSMSQLYDASPLMQNDLASVQVMEYDKERAKLAAQSANAVLKYIKNHPETENRLMSKDEYTDIFYWKVPPYTQPEYLWYNRKQNTPGANYNANEAFTRYVRAFWLSSEYAQGTGNDAASYNAPTQNMVDMYEKQGDDGLYYFRQGQVNVYPTYAINMINGEPEFRQMKQLNLQDDQSRLGEETRRTLGWRANVGYSNRFGKHDVAAMLAYHYYQDEVKGDAQDVKNTNTTLRLNYGFDNKYVFEGDWALMGSNRFEKGNRYFLSGAIGAGWILSNEAFLIDCDAINFLKVKASMGILGYDRSTDFLLYKTAWQNGDNLSLGEQNKSTYHTTQLLRLGNKNLKWERSTEWNIGVEGFFLRNRLKAEINYFNELRDNIIGIQGSAYADVLGNFVSYHNIGKVRNNGIDAYVQWNDRNGDFSYQVGVNITWSKNKLLKWDEVNFPDSYLKTVGKPTDAMMGYQALGLFGKDVSLGRNIPQLLGNYQDGDIAYVDLNNDGVVDARDKKMLGNSYPRTVLGIDANLQYKNWGLYILGTAELGLNVWKNNAYYQNKGEGKYSVLALDRWHPENNPNGTYPRLTTTEGENNFVNSSFWLGNGSYFRLKNVELSYTITNKKENALAKKIKIFGRGTNLFSLSKEKDLDPELINAGINNYPVYRTLTGGVTVTF